MLLSRFLGHDRRLAAADALAEVARLDDAHGPPALLPYSPVSRGNPFQALLYGALPSAGIRPVPAYDLETTRTIVDAVAPDVRSVAHLHWLNVVMQSADDRAHAERLLDQALRQLDALADAGAALAWTVHNVLPHDARFPELELRLRREVVARADLIHVMSASTRALVEPLFPLPIDRTFRVPHPSYDGVYPSWMSRSQARAELGLPEHATVFVLFGRIAPYKGVTELVEAVDRLSRSRPGEVALVLAGDPVPGVGVDELYDRVAAHPAIHGAFRKIPDHQVQVFLRAANAMALPYRRSLNSGALNLALTFGLPVVIPRSSGEADGADPAWAEIYDDGTDDDGAARIEVLQHALARAMDRFADEAAGRAALAAADTVPPAAMADRFATTLRTWLSTGEVPEAVRA